jgi:hypothetical protein
VRQKLGTIVYDLPRFLWAMRPLGGAPWVNFRNRNERLIPSKLEKGVACDWRWTSDLHIAKVFPPLGRWLMSRALRDWPIELRDERAKAHAASALSFIIGHRGNERLPHLLATLRSIASQRDVTFECIVVEQSIRPEIQNHLPRWVRYVHTPLPYAEMPYSRAWAFNVGARAAQTKALILHDSDLLVPIDYAKEVIGRFEDGYEVVNLKRFIFYLSEAHSTALLDGSEHLEQRAPEVVMQNAEAGGSIAINREAYFAIGGFDESFLGWGGEDNEFWERAATRHVWPYGYMPMVHLWHTTQPGKPDTETATKQRFWQMTQLDPSSRIQQLTKLHFGNREAPVSHEHFTNR